MNSKEIFNHIISALSNVYEKREAQNIAFLLLHKLYNLRKQDLILGIEIHESRYNEAQLNELLERLAVNEPIQYVLGEAYFYGLRFKVNADVLIPRPETEELVHLIIQENRHLHFLDVLDIGTGSGCIPISLAKYLKQADIHALDISTTALQVAQSNAKSLEVKICFHELDIFQTTLENLPFWDIIVSNPPYITHAEKVFMQKNVLDYEPHQALFVPEKSDALIFYEQISKLALQRLKKGGKVYFEINENLGNEVTILLTKLGLSNIRLIRDLQDKDRIICANT
jgi:release factor glutamine methyltransferase